MGQQQGGITGLLLPIVLFIGIFYFMIIRPQKKKQQQHDQMLSSISRGDTIITAGGFFGKVSDILDDSYIIELADGVKARILKSSISVRRDASDGGARQPRLKKKDRAKKGVSADEKVDETVVAQQEEGVTSAETSALMSERSGARGTLLPEGDSVAAVENAEEADKGEKGN